jgi:oligoribonuclease
MTGLDRRRDTIMSLCCFITNDQLEMLDENGLERIIHHDKARLDEMGSWCTDTHGKSGLTAACITSKTTAEEAADDILAYIRRLVPTPQTGVMAGSCVQCDRDFLQQEPYRKVVDYLHYRIFDTATLNGAALRWAPERLNGIPVRKELHQAREDILESIEEAKFYRKVFFSKIHCP